MSIEYLNRIHEEMVITEKDIDSYSEEESRANIADVETLRDDLKEHILNPKSERGLKLESSKTHDVFRARPGELTVESGRQGCGKSARHFLRAMSFAMQGQNSLIASLEMRPIETLERGLYQYMGNTQPPVAKIDEFIDQFKGKIFIFKKIGTQTTDRMLNLVRFCAGNNIQHVFIDSLMKCSVRSSDIDSLEEFANQLQGLTKDLNVHVWLIAHQTKGGEGISKEDGVRGSGMLLDLADNYIYYEKNIKKFEAVAKQEQGGTLSAKEKALLDKPDFFMEFRKQRHSTVALPRNFGFYGHESMQFLPSKSSIKMNDDDWKAGKFA